MKRAYAAHGFHPNPVNVSERTWFYTEARELLVVHELRDAKGKYISTVSVKLPYRVLMPALESARVVGTAGRPGQPVVAATGKRLLKPVKSAPPSRRAARR